MTRTTSAATRILYATTTREHYRPARPLGLRGCHAVSGVHQQVPRRDEPDPGDRHPDGEPPSRVHRVAAGPHGARFDGTDQWVAGGAERPAERAEGRDAPGAHQPRRERREHARGERREHEVAEGDLELWHALSLARCAASFSGTALSGREHVHAVRL